MAARSFLVGAPLAAPRLPNGQPAVFALHNYICLRSFRPYVGIDMPTGRSKRRPYQKG